MSRPPRCLTARSAAALKSARSAARCTWVRTFFCPAACTALAASARASSVPASCDASNTLAPASARVTAATRPTACSAPIISAALPASEKSLSPCGRAMRPPGGPGAKLRGHRGDDAGRGDSAGQPAAVDDDEFAVDMVRRLGSEKDRERADVFVLADAADRDELAAFEELHQT